MKKGKRYIISGIVAAMLAMGAVVPAYAAETANPTTSSIYVDGQEIAFEAYNINGNNYFKLRDVAWALSGTSKQFGVDWDDEEKVINLISGAEYAKTGTLSTGDNIVKSATINGAPIMVDGEYVDMMAYNIGGNNFFKLRDLGKQFDFVVDWNGDANAVTIDTDGVVEEVVAPVEEPEKEEPKQEVATDGVRWDLISTELNLSELSTCEDEGLPNYVLKTKTVENHDLYIDTRTGMEYYTRGAGLTQYQIRDLKQEMPENQTFKEGEAHNIPQLGDTVIKADGTKVVIKGVIMSRKVPYGNPATFMFLGFNQGVDIWTGTVYKTGIVVKEGTASIDHTPLIKDERTGEMYSDIEWGNIFSATAPDNLRGKTDGEIYRFFWQWDADAYSPHTSANTGEWVWLGPEEA